MRQFIVDLGTSLIKPWDISQTMLKVLRRSAFLTRSMYAVVALWESYTSTVSLRTLSILMRLLEWSIQISLSSPLYHTLSISKWLYSLMTIPPIAELLSCAKNQMLQKQLKLFSGCGQILLPTLLNACILIMGESIWHQNCNPFYMNRELFIRQVYHMYISKMVEQNSWIRHC